MGDPMVLWTDLEGFLSFLAFILFWPAAFTADYLFREWRKKRKERKEDR